MTFQRGPFVDDLSHGYLDRSVISPGVTNPVFVSNEGENTMLRAIKEELRSAKQFTFSVAFIVPDAVARLKQAILDSGASGTIITSDYLGFNQPAAFKELLNLSRIAPVSVRIFNKPRAGFHSKGYLFEHDDYHTAIIGSSNLTPSALILNKEWNLKFSALPGGDIVEQIYRAVKDQLTYSFPLAEGWIDEYEKNYVRPERATVVSPSHRGDPKDTLDTDLDPQSTDQLFERLEETFTGVLTSESEFNATDSIGRHALPEGSPRPVRILPNAMQVEALEEIEKVRAAGETKAVVISATGTGKTILAALDVRAFAPERMLFVVHREQILDRAMSEFARVLEEPRNVFGKLTGNSRDFEKKYVFATIQSLSRASALESFDPKAFDYILVDEVHKAQADSYVRVLDYFKPQFLLGLTATPERTDGKNIYELFDFNVPYEIRLQKALEQDMLAPFHYYGVTDYVDSTGVVVDEFSDLTNLVSTERVDHLLRAIETYGQVGVPIRGLVFCSRKEECRELSHELNQRSLIGRPLRTVALTGDDSVENRERAVEQLEAGQIDYILTVDIFNEGIDIPSINQVVMLRQTASSIIFTQQLGRGLRKSHGKEYLVVIDFIGNYTNNYLVPIALFGDSSLNKDSIRKKMIEAEESGHVAGISSVSFDRISRERVFRSIASAKLDSLASLKKQIQDLQYRLNRVPKLHDFARFDTVDPVVIAGAKNNYWSLLLKTKFVTEGPTEIEKAYLSLLTIEFLNGKRPQELLLIQSLLANGALSGPEIPEFFSRKGLNATPSMISAVERMLTYEFYTQAEKERYGSEGILQRINEQYVLSPSFLSLYRSSSSFKDHVDDVIETGLFLSRHRYSFADSLVAGERYSRKDACRLLNWTSNQQSTVYGYKYDSATNTCPMFITYHKGDDISSSVLYDEGFVGPGTIRWASKANRTLASREIQQLLRPDYDLHVFVKKDDNEGTDFYYLGKGRPHSPKETLQKNKDGQSIPVVEMIVDLEKPVDPALYDYFVTDLSISK